MTALSALSELPSKPSVVAATVMTSIVAAMGMVCFLESTPGFGDKGVGFVPFGFAVKFVGEVTVRTVLIHISHKVQTIFVYSTR